MNLKNLKEQLGKAGFSEEVLASLNLILNTAIAKGSLSEEERVRMVAIIDGEIESAQVQASVMEEIAFALEEYAGEVDLATRIADEKTKAAEEDFNNEMGNLEEQFKQTSGNSPAA